MLLKVFVDSTFPAKVKPGMAMWVAQDDLPLSHPQNVQALKKALKLPSDTQLSLDKLYITALGAVCDVKKNPVDLGLVANTAVTINSQPPASPRRGRAYSHHSGTPHDGESPEASPRGDASPRADDDDDESPRGVSLVEQPEEEEEYYESADCGWFPFTVGRDAQGVSALVIDPLSEPSVDDREPKTIALCDACSSVVLNCESLQSKVDRHYKPMTLETTVAEGWVEKLAGKRIQRWQKRWLVVSEQSVDWYENEPKPSEKKPKICGTRAVTSNDELTIVSVMTTFDPKQYPKTTDPKFHYFGIQYRNPDQVTLYRTATAEGRNSFVNFLHRMLKRWEQHGGASRDPVFWKQWADSVLTATSEVNDEFREREDAFYEEERESAGLREGLQRIKEARPPLIAANAERLQRVEVLKAQLRELDEIRARHRRTAELAEAKVAEEEARLEDLVQECSEEARHHKFLERRAEEQRSAAASDIVDLEQEIDVAGAAKRRAFAFWRKLEEHHAQRTPPKRAQRAFSFSLDL